MAIRRQKRIIEAPTRTTTAVDVDSTGTAAATTPTVGAVAPVVADEMPAVWTDLAYLADAVILVTYFLTTKSRPVRWFHWANAIGCVPIIATEVIASAWPPLVLTAAFGAIGWMGVLGRDDVLQVHDN